MLVGFLVVSARETSNQFLDCAVGSTRLRISFAANDEIGDDDIARKGAGYKVVEVYGGGGHLWSLSQPGGQPSDSQMST